MSEQFDKSPQPTEVIAAYIVKGMPIDLEALQEMTERGTNPTVLFDALDVVVEARSLSTAESRGQVLERFRKIGQLALSIEEGLGLTDEQRRSEQYSAHHLSSSWYATKGAPVEPTGRRLENRIFRSQKGAALVKIQYEGSWGGGTPRNPRISDLNIG